jgi:hypothetical protein
MSIFKIRKGELFSTGSSDPRFNAKGKVWGSRAAVSGHLALFGTRKLESIYADAVIIEYELIEVVQTPVMEDHDRRLAATAAKYAKIDANNALVKMRAAEAEFNKARTAWEKIRAEWED